jgi:hypothetical protein
MVDPRMPKMYSVKNFGLLPLETLCIIWGTINREFIKLNAFESVKKYIRIKYPTNAVSNDRI